MWQKINDKKYRISLDDNLTDIDVPYAKTEKIFVQFIGNGGLIDEYGNVTTDIVKLIANFKEVGNTLLTKYGPKGEIVEEGYCGDLSAAETIELFQIATDVVESFIQLITEQKKEPVMSEAKEKAKKKTNQ